MNTEVIEMNSVFSFPTKIHFGVGVQNLIINSLEHKNLCSPLIVTDSGVAKLPILEDFVQALKKSGLTPSVYSDIYGNPVKSQVIQGVDHYKKENADCIIGFGGGAALDVAKVIALLIHHPGDLFDYEDGKPDGLPIDKVIPPIYALPTTAGTGSEVGRSSVVSDDKTHAKKIIYSPRLLPEEVFVDPLLTVHLPPAMTAATGLDALTHLIEAYLAVGFHPMCEGIALKGIRLIADNLEKTFEASKVPDAKNKEQLYARGMLMNAAYMGAIAFQKGLGVNHSCAHALSTVCDMHHGLANGIILPYCMEYNQKAVPEKFEDMAKATGQLSSGDEFIPWLIQIRKKLDIPNTLSEVGVSEDHLPDLVSFAFADGCHQLNPCPVSEEDFKNLFKKSIGIS